jgi:exodeoxyribonuclease VII large subunit
MTAPAVSPPRPVRRALTVAQLVNRIQVALEESFPGRIWVEGELSSFKIGRGGHAYCCLRDDAAQVEAVVWGRTLAALPFAPADGMHVYALVRKVDFYGPHGRLRLQIDALEPQGVGALAKALEQLKLRLKGEGLLDDARKRPLPFLPRTVGVATAANGAAIHDMLKVFRVRFAERRVLVRPCQVQGDGAAADIAAAIDDLNREGTSDVIIVGRGGGSVEDLWAFNSEVVARAIARSRIPVVSAVGHESDWTLADLVADARAATPTAAAQRVMPERAALQATLEDLAKRLDGAIRRRRELARRSIEGLGRVFAEPRRLLTDRQVKLDALADRARHALERSLTTRQARMSYLAVALRSAVPDSVELRAKLERSAIQMQAAIRRQVALVERDLSACAAEIDALSPLAVLGRGFAFARRTDGTIVRDATTLHPRETIELAFARGGASAEVLQVHAENASASATRVRGSIVERSRGEGGAGRAGALRAPCGEGRS